MGQAIVYFALAAFFYGVSQSITFGKIRFKGDFWQNWNRKYKQPLEPAPTTWYYKLAVLKYKERFPGSGTILVSLTDGYHFSQLLFKLPLVAAVVSYSSWLGWWDMLIYFVLWGIVFTLSYRWVSV